MVIELQEGRIVSVLVLPDNVKSAYLVVGCKHVTRYTTVGLVSVETKRLGNVEGSFHSVGYRRRRWTRKWD